MGFKPRMQSAGKMHAAQMMDFSQPAPVHVAAWNDGAPSWAAASRKTTLQTMFLRDRAYAKGKVDKTIEKGLALANNYIKERPRDGSLAYAAADMVFNYIGSAVGPQVLSNPVSRERCVKILMACGMSKDEANTTLGDVASNKILKVKFRTRVVNRRENMDRRSISSGDLVRRSKK